ncbi:MAG: hypothetical protein AAGE01_20995 [Pseudomonadota bacterium]
MARRCARPKRAVGSVAPARRGVLTFLLITVCHAVYADEMRPTPGYESKWFSDALMEMRARLNPRSLQYLRAISDAVVLAKIVDVAPQSERVPYRVATSNGWFAVYPDTPRDTVVATAVALETLEGDVPRSFPIEYPKVTHGPEFSPPETVLLFIRQNSLAPAHFFLSKLGASVFEIPDTGEEPRRIVSKLGTPLLDQLEIDRRTGRTEQLDSIGEVRAAIGRRAVADGVN